MEAIEKRNKSRLLEECHSNSNGATTEKTKTAHIIENIRNQNYRREPLKILLHLTKHESKTLLIARFGMLQCGLNYKGTMNPICASCNSTDDEEHRLNVCPIYSHLNFCNDDDKIPFSNIFSENVDTVKLIIGRIRIVWNVRTGHGTINRE